MPLPPASRLGPYEVLSLLDAGGMGEVYKARDTRLGRLVAVKVLPQALSSDAARMERFRQEALAASALNHPNVMSVHDVGTQGGAFFVVSELIDGRTLRARLAEGPLPLATALDYAAQAARGLAAAHEQHIVHRDLKPENLMLTRDGRVKIVDFGVAKVVREAARSPDDGGVLPTGAGDTLPGTLVGTVSYMSPEQVRGEPVDERSDVFSLGAILFEMLTGRRAFNGGTPAETIATILRDDPPMPPGLPRPVELVLKRCLDKSPERRFRSATELTEAIGRATHAATSLPGLARRTEDAPGLDRTVAVLPFTNLSPGQDHEYFSDGLTEQLIHELTRVRGLRVVAWNSAVKLKGREADLHALALQLGAGAVLVGSVRRSGDRVRIAARLVQTATDYYLWSESYDRQIGDLFTVQEEIARAIAKTLERTLSGSGAAASRGGPASVEAYDLYLRGRFIANQRTPAALRRSVETFEQALAADESLALAHAGVADILCLLAEHGLMAPHEAMPRARAEALRALELDPRSSEAHTSLALIYSVYDWEWDQGEAFYRRAIELNPGYSTAHHWLAMDFLVVVGRFDEAREEVDIARQLDPLSLIIQEGKPYLLMMERRYGEAIEAYRALTEMDPSFYKGYTGMGRACSLDGRYDEGIEMLEKGRAIAGDVPNILGALGQTCALAGDSARARGLFSELKAIAESKYVPSTCFALVHSGLGELDEAIAWLERGCDLRELPMAVIKTHPAYDALRGQPRFEALLARMRYPAG